jgi:hypothetical protein
MAETIDFTDYGDADTMESVCKIISGESETAIASVDADGNELVGAWLDVHLEGLIYRVSALIRKHMTEDIADVERLRRMADPDVRPMLRSLAPLDPDQVRSLAYFVLDAMSAQRDWERGVRNAPAEETARA